MKKNIFLAVVIMIFVGTGVVNAGVVIDDPLQLIDIGNAQSIAMELGDNLMERVGGMDVVVDKGEGEYYILLMKELAASTIFGGFLTTDNGGSNSGLPEYAAWMNGYIDRNTFLEGDSPSSALAIFDPDGGQFAVLTREELVLDENLVLWGSGFPSLEGRIEYNGVMDGLQDFVFPVDSPDTLLFKHTVLVNSVPEPGAMFLCCFGAIICLIRKRR